MKERLCLSLAGRELRVYLKFIEGGEDKMPIYEYKAVDGAHCRLCKGRFEVRQGMNDEPLKRCPECGSEIRKLFSRPFLGRKESFSHEGPFNYMEDEADELGLEEDLAEDEVWE
jgi:putative FmdB family regulatory protein